ncbi:MAG: hypothetical protein IKT66_06270, partial [Alistipes sp.]|nr:hypothetical protein [Alistipes sp.]
MSTPLPELFVENMRQTLGDEAESLFAALDTPASVTIRHNPNKMRARFEGEAVG